MSYTNGLDNPELYFQTKLYTGNGTSQSITLDGSENMQPDWVWIKERSSTSDHSLHDSVRGSTKIVKSSTNAAEITRTGSITSFDSDGFSLGDNAGVNENSQTYASWNWLGANGTASNTDGSITSSVSANTTAGFSIVTYTGTGSAGTIGHGLNATPGMIICKNRSSSVVWVVYHHKNTSAPETDYLTLNGTNATTDHIVFNDTAPTSSVFSVAGDSANNESSSNHVAYCFAEKKGFSKFSSYQGSGNSDGPFVYLGFRPAFLMVKSYKNAQDWEIFDNKRSTFNPVELNLAANTNGADITDLDIDFLSNGFKVRIADDSVNNSSYSYIYMAFAESPFVNSNGVPNNAR